MEPKSISFLLGQILEGAQAGNESVTVKFYKDGEKLKLCIEATFDGGFKENPEFKNYEDETQWQKGEIEAAVNENLGDGVPKLHFTSGGPNTIVVNFATRLKAGQNKVFKKWQLGSADDKKDWQLT